MDKAVDNTKLFIVIFHIACCNAYGNTAGILKTMGLD